MKSAAYLWVVMLLCVVSIAVLCWKVYTLGGRVRSVVASNNALRDSLTRVQSEIEATRDLAAGLGEYMSTIQLHAGKLWFGAKAANWPLAQYELDELQETMEAAKTLNAEKNGVRISGVLDSVLETQVPQLAQSIEHGNDAEFLKSYDELLSACNGCHKEAGYGFIHIVRPTAPPVTNQKWEGPDSVP